MLLVMKLSFMLMFMAVFQISASTLSQEKVNLEVKQKSIRYIFKELHKQTGLYFVFSEEEMGDYNVSINVKDVSLDEALVQLFEDTGLAYELMDDYVVVKPASSTANLMQVQKKKLTGRVTDAETGDPIVGANVYTKDQLAGTITNADGDFEITVDGNSKILVFSFIGYKIHELEIGNETVFTIMLDSDVSDLDEVIVTGIFTRKAESFTGAATTIKGEDLKKVGAGNVFQSLQNLDPSLNIVSSTEFGSDPNRMPDIVLRGPTSLPNLDDSDGNGFRNTYLDNPNMPLFILDGFEASPTSIFDFDMDRVQSVTILKDAAAKALYGAKAANGVIVIETKRPVSGDLRLTYNGTVSISEPDLTSYNLCNALEKLEVERIAGDYEAKNNPDLVTQENYYNTRLKRALEGDDTYWLSKPLQTGVSQRHSLRLEMGEQKVKFIAYLGYNKNTGVMKGSDRENVSGSFTLSYRHKDLLFTNQLTLTSNSSNDSPYGKFSDYARMNPYLAAYNEDGSVANDEDITDPNFGAYVNPLYNAGLKTRLSSEYFEVKNNFYAEWLITEGLKLKSRIGLTKTASEQHEFYPAKHTRFDNFTGDDFDRKGSYNLTEGDISNVRGDLYLDYNKSFGKHYVMSNIRFDVAQNQIKGITNYAEGFPSDFTVDYAFAVQYAEGKKPFGTDNTVREMGFMGVFGYTYDNRYLFDLTLRKSGSSVFGANKRWGDFWSVGLGWNLHKEAFLKDLDWLKMFKIRSTLGTTGSQNFRTHQAVSTYKMYLENTYSKQLGAYVKGLANPNLQWQSTEDFNIGCDLVVGGLSLRFERYIANTTDLVNNLTLPPSVGFTSVAENVGEIKNEGYELALSYKVFQGKNGFLNVNAAAVTNTNTIVALSDAMRSYNSDQNKLAADQVKGGKPVQKFIEGESMNTIWAVQSLGIDPATGREIFLNSDGEKTYTWSANDQINAGNTGFKYRGNFGVNGEYKGLGLGVVCRYRTGGQIYNSTLVNKVENINTRYNVDKRVLSGRWKEPGDISQFVRLAPLRLEDGSYEMNPKTRPTTRFVQDLSDLDIASLNVYYRFNKKLIKKAGLSQLKISMNMNDVYKFSTVEIERGTSYPFARTVSFSLNATF